MVVDINRWAELRVLDLWSIAVLQTLGAVMLGMAAAVYLTAGTVWYAVVAVASIRRIRRPAYENILARRRADLARWLGYDGVLVALPFVGLLWFGVVS